ncbi:MAG: dihydrolipoyl dehydrogenase [Pseudomonadota bacterium]
MTATKTCHTLVIGGGPGGYPAAIRAGQLGLDTVLVEAGRLGGTCLIRGCIPSKAIIHAASKVEDMRGHANGGAGSMGITLPSPPKLDMAGLRDWKDGLVDTLSGGVSGLLRAAKVHHIRGWATFNTAKTCIVRTEGEDVEITAENVILATGSQETELPFLPFGEHVISSTGALDLTEVPETLAVIGAGYIGMELGIAFAKLGAKVSFVEAGDTILPSYDAELSRPVAAWLAGHNVGVHLGARATGKGTSKGKQVLKFEDADGKARTLRADKILVAVGRRPRTEGWGLEAMGVDMDRAFIKVDARCETAMRGVYAIGDVTGEPMLAHRATAMGEAAAEAIAGRKSRFDPRAVAAVCFTEPELVGVGLTPDEARASGQEVIVGKFPMAASGRALSMAAGASKGLVRVTARKSDHLILGIHAVGAHVAELSGEFALAMEMGAVLEDLAGTIHVHPTLGETVMESALAALGHPIHIAASAGRPRR